MISTPTRFLVSRVFHVDYFIAGWALFAYCLPRWRRCMMPGAWLLRLSMPLLSPGDGERCHESTAAHSGAPPSGWAVASMAAGLSAFLADKQNFIIAPSHEHGRGFLDINRFIITQFYWADDEVRMGTSPPNVAGHVVPRMPSTASAAHARAKAMAYHAYY